MSDYPTQTAKFSCLKNSESGKEFHIRENSLVTYKSRQAVDREKNKLNDVIDILPVNNVNQAKQPKSKPKILQKSFQCGNVIQSASKEYKQSIQELNRNPHKLGEYILDSSYYHTNSKAQLTINAIEKRELTLVEQKQHLKNMRHARQKPIFCKIVEENLRQDTIPQVVQKGLHQVAQRVGLVTEQNHTLRKQNASLRRDIEANSEKEKMLFVKIQQQSFLVLSKQIQLQQQNIQVLNKQLQQQHQQSLKLNAQSKKKNRKHEAYRQENIGLNRQVLLQKKTIQNMKAEIQKKNEMADGYQRIVILLKENGLLDRNKTTVNKICEDLKYSLKGMTQFSKNKYEKGMKYQITSSRQIISQQTILPQNYWDKFLNSEESRNKYQIKNHKVQTNALRRFFQSFTDGYDQNYLMLKYAKTVLQKLINQKLSRKFNFTNQRQSYDEKIGSLQAYSMFNNVVDTLLKRYSEVINQMLTIGIYLDDHVKTDFEQMKQTYKTHFDPILSLGQQLGMIDQSLEGEQVVSRIIEGIRAKVQGITRSINHVFTDMTTIRDGKEKQYMGEKKRFEGQIAKQNISIKSLEEHLSSKEIALTKKTLQFAKLSSEHSKLQKACQQLGEQKNRLEIDLQSKETALSKKTSQFNKLSGEYSKLDKKSKQLDEQNIQLNAQKNRLQKDSKTMEQQKTLKVRSLENEITEANRKIVSLNESLNRSQQQTKQLYDGLTKQLTTQLNFRGRVQRLSDFQHFFRKYTLSSSLLYGSKVLSAHYSKKKEILINMLETFKKTHIDSIGLIYSLDPLNLDYFKYLTYKSQSPNNYLILFKSNTKAVFGMFFQGVCFKESDNFTGFLFSLDKELLFPPRKQIDQKKAKVCCFEKNESYLYFGTTEMRIGKNKPTLIIFRIGGLVKSYFDISSVSQLTGEEVKELTVQELQIYTVKFK